jgi:hypothetical protein
MSGQQSDARRECAALIVKICPEPPDCSPNEAEIQRPASFKFFRLLAGEKRQQHIAKVFRQESFAGCQRQRSVDPQGHWRPSHKKDVGSLLLDGQHQKRIERSTFLCLRCGCGAIQLIDKLRQIIFVG